MSLLREAPLRAFGIDALFALVLGAIMVGGSFGAQQVWVPPMQPLDGLGWALVVVAAVAVLFRRMQPEVALAGATVVVMAYLASTYAYGPVFLGLAVCVYTVAAHRPVRPAILAGALTAVALLAGHLVATGSGALATRLPPLLLCETGSVLAPWAIGIAVRAYRESHARTRREESRRHTDEQRLLIAQEVHDIVGHGLSVMNMQAGIALHVFDKRPEQARLALEAVKQTSKESLDELRGTLAVFRGDGDDAAPRSPAPGLAQLDALVGSMSRGGLPVELSTTGERTGVPAAVDLAAYRIVQESLTNVVRHARATAADVRVDYGSDELRLDITDNGAPASMHHGDGHGIAGMRTRAAAVGGALEAGPYCEGGFRVRARLPLREPA